MTVDDPSFPRGSIVLITYKFGTDSIATVLKAIKGRDSMRICMGKYNTPSSVYKNAAKVISIEEDPELFI